MVRSGYTLGKFNWNEEGKFAIYLSEPGEYTFRFQAEGYHITERKAVVNRPIDFGTVILKDNMIRLKVATVKGEARLQLMRGDTVIYNPKALSLTPDATLKDIAKQIPGMAIINGRLAWQGKPIDRILVNGQDFFGDNQGIALDHLAAEHIEKVKVYDKASEFTEKTGVEDGKRSTVVDVSIKKEREGTWLGDVHASGGTEQQYELGGFLSRFTKVLRTSFLAEATSRMPTSIDMGSGRLTASGRQIGRNRNQQYAGEVAWNNGKSPDAAGAFSLNAYATYMDLQQRQKSRRAEETYLPAISPVYTLQKRHERLRPQTYRGEIRTKWQADSLTYITLTLQYQRQQNRRTAAQRSATFGTSPYDIGANDFPLDALWDSPEGPLMAIATNRSERNMQTRCLKHEWSVNAWFIRKLAKPGRSLTVNGVYKQVRNTDTQHALTDIRYYHHTNGVDGQDINRQYIPERAGNLQGIVAARYTEPITKGLSLMATYGVTYTDDNDDRPLYQLDSLGGRWADLSFPLGQQPSGDSLRTVLNMRNSVYSTRRAQNHSLELKLSYTGCGWSATVGMRLRPEKTMLDYTRGAIDTSIVRRLCYVAPSLYLKKSWSDRLSLDANYEVTEKYPDLLHMIDFTDDSDPLNVSRGNSGLKPAWKHNAAINARYYDTKRELSVNQGLRFTSTSNAVSSALHYDEHTGVRTVRPENVDGNLTLNYYVNANARIQRNKAFRLSPSFDLSWQHYHSMVATGGSQPVQSSTRALRAGIGLHGSYQKGHTSFALWTKWNGERLKNSWSASNERHQTVEFGSSQSFSLPCNISVFSEIDLS